MMPARTTEAVAPVMMTKMVIAALMHQNARFRETPRNWRKPMMTAAMMVMFEPEMAMMCVVPVRLNASRRYSGMPRRAPTKSPERNAACGSLMIELMVPMNRVLTQRMPSIAGLPRPGSMTTSFPRQHTL